MNQLLSRYFLIIIAIFFSCTVQAQPGALLAHYAKSVNFFTKDKQSGLIYASTRNDITIIDPKTLNLKTIQSMQTMNGLALSEDGSKLYIASPIDQEILIINTASKEIQESIAVPYTPFDLAYSPLGYLYVTLDEYNRAGVMQIALNDKHPVQIFGDSAPDYLYGNTGILIHSDNKVLYFDDKNTTPGTFTKYRITHNNQLELVSGYPCKNVDRKGCLLHFSEDGKNIYYVAEHANGRFTIAHMDTKDMSFKGYLETDNQPNSITTSPDGKIMYIATSNTHIEVWNMEKKKKLYKYSVKNNPADTIEKMITDNSGELLLVARRYSLEIYETGCVLEVRSVL